MLKVNQHTSVTGVLTETGLYAMTEASVAPCSVTSARLSLSKSAPLPFMCMSAMKAEAVLEICHTRLFSRIRGGGGIKPDVVHEDELG